ncbi:MAG: deoxynucleoside kinase [Anaerolineae bacterium]|jgi:deoxyadenosine/deoxycytidine kinase|nr:deoxynucleoside kinase [Anaerolineae bacterium]
MKKFIIVAGNIGVGKSTLVSLLSNHLGWQAFFEPVVENPYLADFYGDMPRWGFHSQVHFLISRAKIHQMIMKQEQSAIQDRSIYEDAEIFARNLYLNGLLSERDYQTYTDLYQTLMEIITPPDLMIYLRAGTETLQQRIEQRNRSYEQTIQSDYLYRLNSMYEDWIHHFGLCPVLTIPAENLDYVSHPQHLQLVADKILQRLSGVEDVVFRSEEIQESLDSKPSTEGNQHGTPGN